MWLLDFFKRKQKPIVLLETKTVAPMERRSIMMVTRAQSSGYAPSTSRAGDVASRPYDPALDFLSPLSPYSPLNTAITTAYDVETSSYIPPANDPSPSYEPSAPASSYESSSSSYDSGSSSSSSYDSGSSS